MNDNRQDIQTKLDEAWFSLFQSGDSRATLCLQNSPGASLSTEATVDLAGKVTIGERIFSDSEEAADFIFTGSRCTFLKTKDDPE
jgi:hypothetical protein